MTTVRRVVLVTVLAGLAMLGVPGTAAASATHPPGAPDGRAVGADRVLPAAYRISIVVEGRTVASLALTALAGTQVAVIRALGGGFEAITSRTRSRSLTVVNLSGVDITVVVTRKGTTVNTTTLLAGQSMAWAPPHRFG